ncbi:MAG: bifunctional oligoribonuclease/PAP phosphatase NrnA [Deltaproteobacteria bacterium]|nr:bifunctional oligoribonuclease/PAP phosphatase NrnA [Deltaproteobacteria bacterium]
MTKHRKKWKGSKSSSRKSDPFQRVIAEIRKGRSFLITTHANPDGDALGSAIALGLGLKKLGKKVKIYNADPVPGNLRFLSESKQVTSSLSADECFDAAFIVDCAEPERVGEIFLKHPNRGRLIVVDHHRKSGRAGDINLIQPTAASTGVVVRSLLKKLRIPITRAIAENIYTTLVTDTGNFRYSNTDASVFGIAKELVETGVSPWIVSKNIYDNYPVERILLLSKILPTLQISSDKRYASIVISQQSFQEVGASSDLIDEFINYPRSINTVEVAIQFRETPDGKWKVSFRSKEFVDVATLAARFGGGGHIRASGCTFEGLPLEEVRQKIFVAVEEALK